MIGLRVPATLGYRHLALRMVRAACRMALGSDRTPSGMVSDFEVDVISAFGEAFNNIAVHGFRGLAPQPIQIDVNWNDEQLVITCVDLGRAFDLESVALPDLDDLPEHGMGLFLMRTCMDEVDYRPGPPNVLRLVKLRTSAPRPT